MSCEKKNYKWAIIQAYYSIFHGTRALLFKAGYREESHFALKIALSGRGKQGQRGLDSGQG